MKIKEKESARQFAAFITDVVKVMVKHKVEDMLCVFGLNGEIRNTYIPISEKGEDPLYCNISDALHQWLQSVGYEKSGTERHTSPINIKIGDLAP